MSQVTLFSISQATAATVSGLFISLAFLCFIRTGSKRVVCPVNGEIVGCEGDLLVFPPGSLVTLENRPVPNAGHRNRGYQADGVYFANDLLDAVFTDVHPHAPAPGIQIVRAGEEKPFDMLDRLKATLAADDLPVPVREHRLLEPLVWLRHLGVRLPPHADTQPVGRLRRLIETDPSRAWRASEVADHFAMSEATLRRWLGRSDHGFSQILRNTRLEHGLALLQTTRLPVSQIALDCGFKTPSHFSDSFKKRFHIVPSAIRSPVD